MEHSALALIEQHAYLIPLIVALPLVGFLLNVFVVRDERTAGYVASGAVVAAFVTALVAVVLFRISPPEFEPPRVDFLLFEWISIGTFRVPFGLLYDPLTAVMVLLVTGVGALIHIYSIGYMHGDARAVRYFAYLNLFIVMMLFLVMGNNLLLLFLGWEGVGLCSFLLIGHWFERKVASEAAVKAFVVNRIGDAAFLLAIMGVYARFNSLNFYTVQLSDGTILRGWLEQIPEVAAFAPPIEVGLFGQFTIAGLIASMLLIGVTGKSAQIPLFVWLPDAMAGPTPVSALIHAATMVTAGVYLMARTSALFVQAPGVQGWVIAIGCLTALLAAGAAVPQWDIKRVLAYSTVSQLGFMVAACGLGVYVAAMFHLLTHGLFKALLFLASGSVIHGTHDTQDMRKMGGLRTQMPQTFRVYVIGALALAGIVPFAGFWSKDEIIAAAFFDPRYLAWGIVLVLTSMLTAFYMGRQVALIFFDRQRDQHYHAHESGPVMLWPLWALAVGAIVGGLINLPYFVSAELKYPGALALEYFLEPVVFHGEAPVLDGGTIAFALVVTLLGLGSGYTGWRYYVRQSSRIKAGGKDPLFRYLGDIWAGAEAAWGFDWLYERAVVRPYKILARWLSIFDLRGIDGIVNGVGRLFAGLAGSLRQAQTGYVRTYALLFLVGVIVVVGYFTLSQ